MAWWGELFRKKTQDWIASPLDASQVPDGVATRAIEPDEGYVEVELSSLRVVHVRKGLSSFHGVVDATFTLPNVGTKPAEFHTVTTPQALQGTAAAGLDKHIPLAHRVLGPTPYRGGDLQMEIGLFSVQVADLTAPYLSLLEKMSKVAGVSQVASALPFLGLLRDGVNAIAGGASASTLEIGASRTAGPPERGYFLVMRASKTEVDVSRLKVTRDMRVVDAAGRPMADYPYFLLKTDVKPRREDWRTLADLQAAYGSLQGLVRKGDYPGAKDALAAFKRTVLTSPDLLFPDGKAIVDTVAKQVSETLGTSETSRTARDLPDLEHIRPFLA